jgi:serine/threonine protein phosphatase PrpC
LKQPFAAKIFAGRSLVEGELHAIGPGLAVVYTARCADLEESDRINEDACALLPIDPMSGLLIVADGAGGLPKGEEAAALSIRALHTSVVKNRRPGSDLRGAVLDGIDQANRRVLGLKVGAASTLAVVEISGHTIRPYHVGDSQIMVIGQRGKVKHITKAHSPVGYALEAGLLETDEAMHHEDRHLVSNLVGAADMHIEVGPTIPLTPHDTVIIASDGLFDNAHQDEIVEACRKGPLLGVASKLATLCRERMASTDDAQPSKPDDLTFIVYRERVSSEDEADTI